MSWSGCWDWLINTICLPWRPSDGRKESFTCRSNSICILAVIRRKQQTQVLTIKPFALFSYKSIVCHCDPKHPDPLWTCWRHKVGTFQRTLWCGVNVVEMFQQDLYDKINQELWHSVLRASVTQLLLPKFEALSATWGIRRALHHPLLTGTLPGSGLNNPILAMLAINVFPSVLLIWTASVVWPNLMRRMNLSLSILWKRYRQDIANSH